MPSADPRLRLRPSRSRVTWRQAVVPGPVLVAAPRHPASKSRRDWRPVMVASVVVHLLVIIAFWLPVSEPKPELASPPGVSMLFDEGAKAPTQAPGPETSAQAPMAAPSTPSAETPPSQPAENNPPSSPPIQPDSPPTQTVEPLTPPIQQPSEAQPQTPTSESPPQDQQTPEPPTTADLPQAPADKAPAVHFQPSESPLQFAAPVPIPQPLPAPPPPLLHPPPLPRPAPPAPSPAQNAFSFPRPMFNSLGTSFAGVPEGKRDTLRPGGSTIQPFAQTSGTPLGADWNALFRSWVESHKYYPEQAAQLGQQGVVAVEITIQRDGRVSDLHLVQRSGSPWLDMALQSMFRDARVPAFLPGTTDPSVTYRVQMTYQLR